MPNNSNYRSSFALLTSLFFTWGFLTCLNDILVPYLKGVFSLNNAESMLVQFSFFIAYFVGSVAYFFISASYGDPINKIGYKNGIIAGLCLSATGLFLFYPAAEFKSFAFFLSALFVLGLGFTILQIAANPYVSLLGSPETASGRLNLAGGFNSFGTTIAPVIGGYLIFEVFGGGSDKMSVDAVKVPYLIFGGLVLMVALIFRFIHLPEFTKDEKTEKSIGALRYPHLVLGVVAIFMYVGGEVAIGSIMTHFLEQKEIAGLAPSKATVFVSLYWGGLMIGRFTGSTSMSNASFTRKLVMAILIPAIVFPFLLGMFNLYVHFKKGFDIDGFMGQAVVAYPLFIALLVVGFATAQFRPARTLLIFSLINAALITTALLSSGPVAVWTLVSTGLFCSVMWPIIFTLAINGLGKDTSQGSSLLVMGILGGALIPVAQGALADFLGDDPVHQGVHHSIIIPAICFLYLAFYGWYTRNILSQNVKDNDVDMEGLLDAHLH